MGLAESTGVKEIFPGKQYLMGEPMLHMTQADGNFYWIHSLSMQGFPRNIPGWYETLKKLKRAVLEEYYIADHGRFGGYFRMRFPPEPENMV
jgi:hypothetical protein